MHVYSTVVDSVAKDSSTVISRLVSHGLKSHQVLMVFHLSFQSSTFTAHLTHLVYLYVRYWLYNNSVFNFTDALSNKFLFLSLDSEESQDKKLENGVVPGPGIDLEFETDGKSTLLLSFRDMP